RTNEAEPARISISGRTNAWRLPVANEGSPACGDQRHGSAETAAWRLFPRLFRADGNKPAGSECSVRFALFDFPAHPWGSGFHARDRAAAKRTVPSPFVVPSGRTRRAAVKYRIRIALRQRPDHRSLERSFPLEKRSLAPCRATLLASGV